MAFSGRKFLRCGASARFLVLGRRIRQGREDVDGMFRTLDVHLLPRFRLIGGQRDSALRKPRQLSLIHI